MTHGREKHTVAAGMALALLVLLAGCGGSSRQMSRSATVPGRTSSQGARLIITPGSMLLFVRVTFDQATTYDQALAILAAEPYPAHPYPWTCDDPRSPTPPPLDEQRGAFDATHALYLSYPSWEQVTRIASSDHVILVERVALYMCD